jgi:hypothetical protein
MYVCNGTQQKHTQTYHTRTKVRLYVGNLSTYFCHKSAAEGEEGNNSTNSMDRVLLKKPTVAQLVTIFLRLSWNP